MKNNKFLWLGALALLLVAVPALAHGTLGKVTNPQGDEYDLIEVSGQVQESEVMPHAVKLQTNDGEEYEVMLGPVWYKNIEVKPGDVVTVKGVLHGDDNEIAAFTLTQADGTTVTVREQLGRPAWAGRGYQGMGKMMSGDKEYGSRGHCLGWQQE